jgi:AcrR family transcriptional regulator
MTMETKALPRGAATRERALLAAITLLTESGISATTTRAVQEGAGLTRGAFLHHYPTRELLLAAVVEELVDRRATRAQALIDQFARRPPGDRLTAAVQAVRSLFSGPDFLAEMELWSAARTDPALMAAIIPVERRVGQRLRHQLAELFGDEIAARPGYQTVASLTVELARGLALSSPLRQKRDSDQALLDTWARAATGLLG